MEEREGDRRDRKIRKDKWNEGWAVLQREEREEERRGEEK